MYIEKVEINNFRNLDGIKMRFDSKINFIVGENNLGKSNLLDCLNTVFNYNRFKEDDFFNPTEKINISLTLVLEEEEIGAFDDFFDPNDSKKINIQIEQENPNEYFKYYHKESSGEISSANIRNLNFIKYSSLRSPKDELSFDKNKGVGKVLSFMVKKYLDNKKRDTTKITDFINEDEFHNLRVFINEKINLIDIFEQFFINAYLEDNLDALLYKMLVLKEKGKYNLEYSGHGVQFYSMISLVLLEHIIKILEYKNSSDENKNQYISVIMCLDEPEIHLHPYLQRSLIKYIFDILNNKNENFRKLLKELFELEGIRGQVILVTHSPNIILNDYKQVVRFFVDNEKKKISVVSGSDIIIQEETEKHLLRNFPYFKEAFFSRCAIIVEGDSELGAFPLFAETMGIDLDDNGIIIIKAEGKESIPKIAELLKEFKIPFCAFADRDDEKGDKISKWNFKHEITACRDFEEEVCNNLICNNKKNILYKIFYEMNRNWKNKTVNISKINDRYQIVAKNNLSQTCNFLQVENGDEGLQKLVLLSWLNKKSVILGRIIGENLTEELIPNSLKKVLSEAEKLSKKVT